MKRLAVEDLKRPPRAAASTISNFPASFPDPAPPGLASIRTPIVAMIHHPLGLETGLARAAIAASPHMPGHNILIAALGGLPAKPVNSLARTPVTGR